MTKTALKIFFMLAVVAGLFALAAMNGRLQVESIFILSPEARFAIGFFTIGVGISLFRFLQLFETGSSIRAVSITRFLFSMGVAFPLALLCLNSYTASLLIESPRKLANAGIPLCPVADSQEPDEKAKSQPGCELIDRAFELGLVKSRGSCEPTEQEVTAEICHLRQADEPILHYSARRLAEFGGGIRDSLLQREYWLKIQDSFREYLRYFKILEGRLYHVLQSAPHSSHHIFTDLPRPETNAQEKWTRWFKKKDCSARYRDLSYTLAVRPSDPAAASQILDHVYGQMLFNPKYGETSGLCGEYTIHWNSAQETCRQLAQKPDAFLKKISELDEVNTILNRLDEHRSYKRLKSKLTSIATGLPPPLPPPPKLMDILFPNPKAYAAAESLISFQCLLKANARTNPTPRIHSFTLENQAFQAREWHLPPPSGDQNVQVGMYKFFAQAMVDGFRYSGHLNKGAATSPSWQVGPELFQAGDLPLARLEYLKESDIFFGDSWLQERRDLLDVYPYYHHLYHFIEAFRRQYRLQKTRL